MLRTARGLTQVSLGRELGVHCSYVSQIEHGRRNISILNAMRLADALGVVPGELLDHLPRTTAAEDG
jgi:transcriptional regulator with XRE-family HTH domain